MQNSEINNLSTSNSAEKFGVNEDKNTIFWFAMRSAMPHLKKYHSFLSSKHEFALVQATIYNLYLNNNTDSFNHQVYGCLLQK
ncbi:hypothetical protein A6S26_06370 [Nostoc sp. ATCC 43529]|nr:hypothetical protein A6S26_06370 [Nostoc sp. ATCC 43529]